MKKQLPKAVLAAIIPENKRRRSPKGRSSSKYYGVTKRRETGWTVMLTMLPLSGKPKHVSPVFSWETFNTEEFAARWISMIILVYLKQGKTNKILLNGFAQTSLVHWHRQMMSSENTVVFTKDNDTGLVSFLCGRCNTTTVTVANSQNNTICGCCGSKFLYDESKDEWTSDFEYWMKRFIDRASADPSPCDRKPQTSRANKPLCEHKDTCRLLDDTKTLAQERADKLKQQTLELNDLREKLKARDESIENLKREHNDELRGINAALADFEKELNERPSGALIENFKPSEAEAAYTALVDAQAAAVRAWSLAEPIDDAEPIVYAFRRAITALRPLYVHKKTAEGS